MSSPTTRELAAVAAVAAVTETADLISRGGHLLRDTHAHRLLSETDIQSLTLLAAVLLRAGGEDARGALRRLALFFAEKGWSSVSAEGQKS